MRRRLPLFQRAPLSTQVAQKTLQLGLVSAIGLSSLTLFTTQGLAKLPDYLEGTITHQGTRKALAGVRVQQADSLAIVITDDQGHFRLPLNENSPPELHIEKQGFETLALAIQEDDTTLDIGLAPLNVYQRQQAAKVRNTSLLSQRPRNILDTGLSGFYQAHGMSINQNDAQVNGFGVNELGVEGQYRLNDWLLGGQFFNFRLPIAIENFPYSPAFFTNESQLRLSALYSFQPDTHWQWAIGPEVLYRNTSPDNRNTQDKAFIPFSNTHLDYPQNSFALGLRAQAGWQITDQLTLLPEVSVYPAGIANIEQPESGPLYMAGGNLGASLRYSIVPGLAVVGNYTKQVLWTGPALEQGDFLRIGLHLDPWQMLQDGKE